MGTSVTAAVDAKDVARALAPYLGGARPTLTPIQTGKFNTSFYVRADGADWVVRVAPPESSTFVFYERSMMKQEPGIHARLLDETTVPVAPVVAFNERRTVLDRDFLLLERLEGHPLSEHGPREEADVLFQVGQALAQTHRIKTDRFGYLGEHRPMAPQATWTDAFRVMWGKLIDDVEATGHYSRGEAAGWVGLLEGHLHRFEREVPSSLLHMDVWAQNILVDDAGALTGLIDWDRALWGDPEIEFAVLDYCGISHSPFWEGYGAEREQSTDAGIRQRFYLLYELQKYIVIEQGRRNNPRAAQRYKHQCIELTKGL